MKNYFTVLVFVSALIISSCDLFNPGDIDSRVSDASRDNPLDVDRWERLNSFPESYTIAETSFTVGSYAYVGLGYKGSLYNQEYLKDFYRYNPLSDSWSSISDFTGTARIDAVTFSIGDKGYVGMGQNEDAALLTDFWEYDSGGDRWTQVSDIPGNGSSYSRAISINGKGYVAEYADEFWEYTPETDTWSQITLPAAVTSGGYSLIWSFSSEVTNTGFIAYLNNTDKSILFYEYTPPGTWTLRTSPDIDLSTVDYTKNVTINSSWVINNKGYIHIKELNNNGEDYLGFFAYDIAGDSWSRKTDFPVFSYYYYPEVSYMVSDSGYVIMNDGSNYRYIAE